jgi:hypothetical protein
VRATRRAADLLGYDTVWRDHYSPVPDVRMLDDAWWAKPSELAGVTMDYQRQLSWLDKLAPTIAAFRPARTARFDTDYAWQNASYEAVDAHILHAVIRQLRPRRVLELGSGRSTLVTAAACQQNEAEGSPVEFVAADPSPQPFIQPPPPGVSRFLAVGAREIDAKLFAQLEAGDVLFVDTTHTVKVGSEVNYLILDVLPRLVPGVRVHFHDVFLPYEYPREWIRERGFYWAEQYLLQAFLAENPCWEISCATFAISQRFPERLAQLVPEAPRVRPSSIWLKRLGPSR